MSKSELVSRMKRSRLAIYSNADIAFTPPLCLVTKIKKACVVYEIISHRYI